MNKHIYLASPHMSEEGYEQEYIKEAFDTNWIAPLGKNVTEFESEVAAKLNINKAVALSSGTAAIHMALKAVGIQTGDFVFCQSFTFAATANPILYEKAVPVFIDSEEETWNMDPVALKKSFEKYCRMGTLPKAVIVVHLYGICAKMDAIISLCRQYQVPLIEDAAESLGSSYKGSFTGSFGDYGIISFNGNKIITTSGGGMLLVNAENADEAAQKVLFWATQAREPTRWYQHEEIGYNYRMSNVVAGIGRGQLRVLEKRMEKKKSIFNYYKQHLGDIRDISFMPEPKDTECNCWLSVAQLSTNGNIRPLDLMLALEKNDIESRPVWKPLHLQPVFQFCDFVSAEESISVIDPNTGADNSIAGKIFQKGICLPSDTKLTTEDLERICKIIKNLWYIQA